MVLLRVVTTQMAVDDQSMMKFEEIFEVIFVQTGHGHHIGVVVLLE